MGRMEGENQHGADSKSWAMNLATRGSPLASANGIVVAGEDVRSNDEEVLGWSLKDSSMAAERAK